MSTDTDTRCGYHENNRRCRETETLAIQLDGKPVRLCERHLKSEFHPDDIKRRLPGKIAQARADASVS